ncbi:MAG: LPS export ABC transporter permease LptG [Nevskiales bacterium]
MRLIHNYILRSILGTTLIVALAIAAISAVLALVDELDNVGKGNYGLLLALQFVALQLPRGVYELFPIIVLLGTVLGLGGLANGSELVAMRAAGVSLMRLAGSALRAGMVFALACIFISEWLAPRAEAIEHRLRAIYNLEDKWSKLEGGIWLRDGDSFIHVGTVVSTRLLREIHVYRFGPDHQLQIAVEADNARYDNQRWELLQVRYTEFGEARIKSHKLARMDWNTSINPALLQVSVMAPDRQTMRTLYQYAEYLRQYQLDASHYQIALWSKAAVPVMVLVMVLLAIPFVVGPLRTTGAGQRMFVGMVVGVMFFLLNEITLSTGLVYGLSPLLTAWLPTALLGAIALAWLIYLNWPAPVSRLLRLGRA